MSLRRYDPNLKKNHYGRRSVHGSAIRTIEQKVKNLNLKLKTDESMAKYMSLGHIAEASMEKYTTFRI